MGGEGIDEQALVADTPKGVTVITGCAHPGIVKIAEKVRERFSGRKPYCVIGGFHLNDRRREEVADVVDRLRILGVSMAGPAHCSGKEASDMFKKTFGKNFIAVTAGKEYEV